MFTKAISNIISNAVNYTDEGKEIRVYIKDKKLIIENDCKPISDEHLAHIFEAFIGLILIEISLDGRKWIRFIHS